MAQGILSKGTKLSYKTTGTTYVDVAYLQSVPDLGGEADTVEVTTLDDGARKYIQGIKDYGDLEFELLYDNSSATASYRVIRGLEEDGEVVGWKINFPDGTTFTFSGQVSTKIAGFGVGDPITFTAKVTLNSDITVTNPA